MFVLDSKPNPVDPLDPVVILTPNPTTANRLYQINSVYLNRCQMLHYYGKNLSDVTPPVTSMVYRSATVPAMHPTSAEFYMLTTTMWNMFLATKSKKTNPSGFITEKEFELIVMVRSYLSLSEHLVILHTNLVTTKSSTESFHDFCIGYYALLFIRLCSECDPTSVYNENEYIPFLFYYFRRIFTTVKSCSLETLPLVVVETLQSFPPTKMLPSDHAVLRILKSFPPINPNDMLITLSTIHIPIYSMFGDKYAISLDLIRYLFVNFVTACYDDAPVPLFNTGTSTRRSIRRESTFFLAHWQCIKTWWMPLGATAEIENSLCAVVFITWMSIIVSRAYPTHLPYGCLLYIHMMSRRNANFVKKVIFLSRHLIGLHPYTIYACDALCVSYTASSVSRFSFGK